VKPTGKLSKICRMPILYTHDLFTCLRFVELYIINWMISSFENVIGVDFATSIVIVIVILS